MKKLLLSLTALLIFGLPTVALADVVTYNYTAPTTAGVSLNSSGQLRTNPYQGGPNQVDLDHHRAYTWRINASNVNLNGKVITSASITFKNISNWDTNANRLFVHLLDNALGSGIQSFVDASGVPVPASQIVDAFNSNNPLVANGTGNTFLFDRSFNMAANGTAPGDFTYNFTQSQLNALFTYIQNDGFLAFGLDPDCHFWNNGITFKFKTDNAPVPEPTTMVLLGTGLAGIYARRRKQQKARSEV